MGHRLENKTAFVTAAGQGIGRAIAETFAAEGARVTATDLDASKLDGLDHAGVHALSALDVRDTEAVKALAATAGPVDILVNAAGFVHHGTLLDCTEDDWAFSFDLNVTSMHRTQAAFVPKMLESGGGSIINVASLASSIKGVPNRYAYGASKAAVIGMTKALAIDFVSRGLRANCICPGTIQSPSLDERIEALGQQVGGAEEARRMFIERQPMGRLGTPQEIAALAVYLASDDATFVTGQNFVIDGGMAI